MRYYLNVVTFGYTTAFRDRERWEPAGIDLLPWLLEYSRCRYGSSPAGVSAYWDSLLRGPYGSFTDHPRFSRQGRSSVLG